MVDITFYDNLDDMWDDLRDDMEEADKQIEPWQALVKPGEYFVRDTRMGFRIYGQVLEDPEDCKRDEYTENYRFCRAFSVACPEGEFGDIHVSTIEKIIAKEEFEGARRNRWSGS